MLRSRARQNHLLQTSSASQTSQGGAFKTNPCKDASLSDVLQYYSIAFSSRGAEEESTTNNGSLGSFKLSVEENKIFRSGPPDEIACPIFVLQQANGAFAGLLRLMTDCHVDQETPLELIAISTGSVKPRDLNQSLEWEVFKTGKSLYRPCGSSRRVMQYAPECLSKKGKRALMFDDAMAFDQAATGNIAAKWDFDAALANINQLIEREIKSMILGTERRWNWTPDGQDILAQKGKKDPTLITTKAFLDNEWFKVRSGICVPLNREARGAHMESPKRSEIICEFYNVLWIERRDGIAYRRACGWVPKHIWEALATGPVEVKLG